METHEVNLTEVLNVAAMSIKMDDKEQKPYVDPELLRRELEKEDWYVLGFTPLS